MAAWKLIKIMPNLYSRFEYKIKCVKCGQTLDVGDEAWAHSCPRKQDSYTEYYCLFCFETLWHE